MSTKKTPQQTQQEYAQRIADELITMIKAGTAPFQIPWKPANGRDLPYNHLTGKNYSGSNSFYLMMQHRSDPRWLTYQQAQSINAQVRKGEHGIPLIKLITHAEQIKRDEQGKAVIDAKGEPVTIRTALERPFIKRFTVFNAEQIDGLPALIKEPLPELSWSKDNPAEKILQASKAEIKHQPGNSAHYNLNKDWIVLPEKAQFPDAGSYYATALHELGHWTGHQSRLGRDLSGKFGSESYAREELRAEIASMMINRQLGMPHDPERHASYVSSWVKVLQDEPTEILHACRDAQKIQNYVLAFQQQQQITQESPTETLTPAQERLNRTKEAYLSQIPLLSKTERQQRQVREYGMEKVIANLPQELKAEAQANFYENEVKASIKTLDVPASKLVISDELDLER